MNEPPPIPPMAPLPRDQRNIDADHLNLLSIFYFVSAGLALLGVLFLIGHYAIMHFIFSNPEMWRNQRGGPPPQQFFAIFIVVYIVVGAMLLVASVLNLLCGLFLHARKNRTFSLIVAGINCAQVPLGTILGVFTIIVLSRASVRDMYEGRG